jgi:Holliday junction resolvase RusA-like endonuclease
MLTFVFGFSNEASDIDNAIKSTQDILGARYGFDDKRIYALRVVKIIVPKGEDYIAFSIDPVTEKDYEKSLKELLAMIR